MIVEIAEMLRDSAWWRRGSWSPGRRRRQRESPRIVRGRYRKETRPIDAIHACPGMLSRERTRESALRQLWKSSGLRPGNAAPRISAYAGTVHRCQDACGVTVCLFRPLVWSFIKCSQTSNGSMSESACCGERVQRGLIVER